MAKSTGGVPLLSTGIEKVSLPLAVETLVVDGKRLTASFYRQITEAELIAEETGELRGLPIGFFHLHSKQCPEIEHKHVLWGMGKELHLSTVFAIQEDQRYQRQKKRSEQRQERMSHLLALLLALAGHALSVQWVGQDEREVAIAGYTLYVNEDIANHLERLHMAREQRKQDEEAWQARRVSEKDTVADMQASDQEQGASSVEQLLAQLDQQGIELKHPARDKFEGKELEVYGLYTDDARAYGALGGQTTWCRYPASIESGSGEEAPLYWRAKDRLQRQLQAERLAPLVTSLLTPRQAGLLRLHLAERMVRTNQERTRHSAGYLLRDADIAALLQQKPHGAKARAKEAPSLSLDDLDPDHVWACYERETRRDDAFTARWKDSLEHIQSVQQLFLVS